jgi:hypothetical protein
MFAGASALEDLGVVFIVTFDEGWHATAISPSRFKSVQNIFLLFPITASTRLVNLAEF